MSKPDEGQRWLVIWGPAGAELVSVSVGAGRVWSVECQGCGWHGWYDREPDWEPDELECDPCETEGFGYWWIDHKAEGDVAGACPECGADGSLSSFASVEVEEE
jgi:hypothetical protein